MHAIHKKNIILQYLYVRLQIVVGLLYWQHKLTTLHSPQSIPVHHDNGCDELRIGMIIMITIMTKVWGTEFLYIHKNITWYPNGCIKSIQKRPKLHLFLMGLLKGCSSLFYFQGCFIYKALMQIRLKGQQGKISDSEPKHSFTIKFQNIDQHFTRPICPDILCIFCPLQPLYIQGTQR